MNARARELTAERTALRRYMRKYQIKRRSCFNGGHSPESYRCNAKLFEIETLILRETTRRGEDA